MFKVGFPVLVRPSYVLSGAAMRVVTSDEQLREFLQVTSLEAAAAPLCVFVEVLKCMRTSHLSFLSCGAIHAGRCHCLWRQSRCHLEVRPKC